MIINNKLISKDNKYNNKNITTTNNNNNNIIIIISVKKKIIIIINESKYPLFHLYIHKKIYIYIFKCIE